MFFIRFTFSDNHLDKQMGESRFILCYIILVPVLTKNIHAAELVLYSLIERYLVQWYLFTSVWIRCLLNVCLPFQTAEICWQICYIRRALLYYQSQYDGFICLYQSFFFFFSSHFSILYFIELDFKFVYPGLLQCVSVLPSVCQSLILFFWIIRLIYETISPLNHQARFWSVLWKLIYL